MLPRAAGVNFYAQSAHLFSGWQLSLISWGFLWTNRRKGLYFLWLLVEGRHLVVFSSGYLELDYLVWLQCRFELWRSGEAVLRAGLWMEKQNLNEVWPSLLQLVCAVCRLVEPWQQIELFSSGREENLRGAMSGWVENTRWIVAACVWRFVCAFCRNISTSPFPNNWDDLASVWKESETHLCGTAKHPWDKWKGLIRI